MREEHGLFGQFDDAASRTAKEALPHPRMSEGPDHE